MKEGMKMKSNRRQIIRKTIALLSMLLFPLTFNYFSPYLSVDGAFRSIISASVITFALLFISSLFLGRAWCGWICPVAGLSEAANSINNSKVNRRKLRKIRLAIFSVWFTALLAGFIKSFISKGSLEINPLYMTEKVVSIDEPFKFITYYAVVLIIVIVTLALGQRGACHSFCWMSPIMSFGSFVGRKLRLPQLMVSPNPESCISCGRCDKTCQMSIDVSDLVKAGENINDECILCLECVDICPKESISLKWIK